MRDHQHTHGAYAMCRGRHWALALGVWVMAATALRAESLPPEALFQFLFPSARVERSSTGYQINHAGNFIRAESTHGGWRIYLPNGETWQASSYAQGWRVINAAGQAIELTGRTDGTLRGTTFDGQSREVRPVGGVYRADDGMDAYWDHAHRAREEKKREEPKGLKTRSRFLNER